MKKVMILSGNIESVEQITKNQRLLVKLTLDSGPILLLFPEAIHEAGLDGRIAAGDRVEIIEREETKRSGYYELRGCRGTHTWCLWIEKKNILNTNLG